MAEFGIAFAIYDIWNEMKTKINNCVRLSGRENSFYLVLVLKQTNFNK